jgi:CheY-like chemotaxis protein
MNAVIGMSHLALKTDLTSKQRNYLTKIQSSANSLLGIINDILDFSKIEAGKLDMETVDFNLDAVLDNLANLVTVKAQEKEELEVLFATAAAVPRSLVGDPLRLGQVLINLANNAVKFTESGEIVVSTDLIKLDENKNEVNLKFSVRDSGIGMTEEQMARLFQSFSQADTSTTRKYGGTGLGLAISKRLVEMMNGEIWVESQAGQGSTFYFSTTFGRSRAQEKKQQIPPQDLRGMKTLVVDDNATSRQILQEMLASFSFNVTLAASGKEGLAELEKAATDQPFELVIMDWKMPGMDGIETSRHIKAHTHLSKIPAIILVTAYGREEIMHQAESEDLDGFLIKPLSPSVLFDSIMHAFGKVTVQRRPAFAKDNEMTVALKNIQGAHLLLVEDNEINQQVAREILEGAGFMITLADDGQEAVDAVKQNKYDAVLMDIQMPVLDGYSATRKIREWESGNRNAEGGTKTEDRGQRSEDRGQRSEDRGQRTEVRGQKKGAKDRKPTTRNQKHAASDQQPEARNQRPVPIIAMTAHAMAGDQEKSLAAGMNDHVNKPIDPGQLFSTLVKWIQPPARKTGHPEPQAVAAPADPDTLPESLPGFDLSEGLNRLQGNQKLYKKLLLSLADKYSEIGSEIRETLEIKDWDQAHSLVHTLKGMAGNLAAIDVQAAAVDLEKLVKHADPKAPPAPDNLQFKFTALENALNQALAAVGTLRVVEEKKITEPSTNQIATLSAESAKDAAKRLRDAAEMGDVTELNEITDEFRSSSDAFAPYAEKIVQLADEFDFESILKMADDLEKLADA